MKVSRLLFLLVLLSAVRSIAAQVVCPLSTTVNTGLPKPVSIAPMSSAGSKLISGKFDFDTYTPGNVVACIKSGDTYTSASTPLSADKTFVFPAQSLKIGDVVTVQFQRGAADSANVGLVSEPVKVSDTCSDATDQSAPMTFTLGVTLQSNGKYTISGTASNLNKRSLRYCVNNVAVDTLKADDNGKFSKSDVALTAGDPVQVQALMADNTHGPISNIQKAPATPTEDTFHAAVVAGYEQSGYSSLGQSGEPFIQGFFTQNFAKNSSDRSFLLWARVRLLGAPQPSTNGIGSTFTDPTGTITKQDFTKIGNALDYSGGLGFDIAHPSTRYGRILLVAGFGATTPLSSQSATLVFKTPAAGTYECSQLISRFTGEGYPTLNPGTSNCLLNSDSTKTPIVDIAFTGQDRSNFFPKWGAGLRLLGVQKCATSSTSTSCADAYRVIDLTLGQDAAITGGHARTPLFKIDALYPVPITDSFFYIFGSSYVRFAPNVYAQPLILATETTTPTIPSATVLVLPYKQPDRDYFRLGIGINLAQVFCKFSTTACPK